MPGDDDAVERGEEGSEFPISEELIGDDMPCLRCGYNLRGLKPEGQCPECGARIEKTVAYVMQRVLCPICFTPNHPTVALCSGCRTPLTNAAVTADYWRPRPMAARARHADDEEAEPDRPSAAWPMLCWMFGLICLGKVALSVVNLWAAAPDPFEPARVVWVQRVLGTLLLSAVAGVLGCILYFPLRGYLRMKREYEKKYAAYVQREAARDEEWRQASRTPESESDA